MKVFSISKNVKGRFLFIFLILAALTSWVFIFGIRISLHSDVFAKILGLFIMGAGLIPLLLTLWAGMWVYFLSKIKLIFSPLSVEIPVYTRFSFFGLRGIKPFNLKYEQIKSVQSSEIPDVIHLTDSRGRSIKLIASAFGEKKGEDVLLELKQYLPGKLFDSDLTTISSKKKISKLYINQIFILLGLLLGLFSMALLQPSMSFRQLFFHAWNVEQNLPFAHNSEAFSAQSRNDYWTIIDDFGDYMIYHKRNGEISKLSVPKLNENEHPQFISEDKGGNPILWLETRILYFDGEWKSIDYPSRPETYGYLHMFAVKGAQALYIENVKQSANKIILMDATSGNSKEILLPETAIQEKLSPIQVKLAANGEFIVLMNGETGIQAYLLSENGWNDHRYRSSFLPLTFMNDMFLDQHGSLWLLDDQNVEKVTLDGVNFMTRLPSPHNGTDRYEYLIVDSHERLWVQGSYPEFMAVFQPSWNDEAVELQYYMAINSNFNPGSQDNGPVMTPEGIILSPGYFITSMDTNVETPPVPFPWLGTQDPLKLQFILLIYQIVLFIFMLGNTVLLMRSQSYVPNHR